ncbi:thiol S-methyltransferase TMT1A-like [Osmerus mordax]|uniref:Methyltransferase-like protein 7A n=1 Tax=Osmerus mordax TaxID=8014 RepID=C1BLY5_OSMMO|nr:Methyltransferase-like protein 7A precursor [Osmerus mordax]
MGLCMNLLTLFFTVVTLPLQLMEALGVYGIYKRIFPILLYKITLNYNKVMHDKKKDLFSTLMEFKLERPLRILEIGCGCGANFQFYPPACNVICTDPNPHFQKYLDKSMEENDHLTFDRFVVASGEDMGVVEDGSVDVVVCTLVLCSVNNVPRTLQEVYRILRPGGALYFLEHVISDPSSWTYFFQHVLQPMWYYFGDGCELTRATWKDLETAGFSELKLRHIEAPVVFLIKPHIMGYVVK